VNEYVYVISMYVYDVICGTVGAGVGL